MLISGAEKVRIELTKQAVHTSNPEKVSLLNTVVTEFRCDCVCVLNLVMSLEYSGPEGQHNNISEN